MDKNKELFLHTSTRSLFWKMAAPGAVSMLAATMFSMVDGIFIGQILGEVAFAAANLAISFTIVNFALAELIGTGSSVPISIYMGMGEKDKANNYFSCACILIVLTGIIMGAILYFGSEKIMLWMGAGGILAQMAADYLKVYAICSPITTMTFAVDNYLRICGQNKLSMLLNIFNYGMNIALDFVFLVYMKLPLWSAALATCITMMTCTIIGMLPFAFRRLQLTLCSPRFSSDLLKQIVVSGGPSFLNTVAGRITSIAMNISLLHFGGASVVAIYGILMYCGDIVYPLLYGICNSLQPAIGYNYGAKRLDRVRELEKYILVTVAGVSAIAVTFLLSVPELFANLFLQQQEVELLGETVVAIRIYALGFVTIWFGFAVQNLYTSLNMPMPAAVLSVCEAFAFPMLLLLLLWGFGVTGIWFNSVLTSFLVAILAGILRWQSWKNQIC